MLLAVNMANMTLLALCFRKKKKKKNNCFGRKIVSRKLEKSNLYFCFDTFYQILKLIKHFYKDRET